MARQQSNPPCPRCRELTIVRIGKSPDDRPRWRCQTCKFSWTEEGKSIGRPPKSVGICPYCGSDATKKNGGDRSLCKDCGRTWSQTND